MRRHVATFVAAALCSPSPAPPPPSIRRSESPPARSPRSPEPTPSRPTPAPEATPATERPPDDVLRRRPSDAPAEPTPPHRPGLRRPDRPLDRRLQNGTDVAATSARQAKRGGFTRRPHVQPRVPGPHGQAQPEAGHARSAADPRSLAVVPDEKIELAGPELVPTGIDRIDGRALRRPRRSTASTSASTPTSRSSTRASPRSPTSTSPAATTARPRTARSGATSTATGPTSPGPSARIDNGDRRRRRRSGRPPVGGQDPRTTAAPGLLSWYVCGLDWIAAQRDPADSVAGPDSSRST